MEILDGVIRHYDWGSATAIPELLGQSPDGRPWAELWMGANRSAPSVVGDPGRFLNEVIDSDPTSTLGRRVHERFDELPFLFKVLSAAEPLSIQVHPSCSQAEAGFDRESAAGISLDAPTRSFRDRNHKPELICALTTFDALCGFREPRRTLDFLGAVDAPGLDPLRVSLAIGGQVGIARAVGWIFSLSGDEIESIVGEVEDACQQGEDDEFAVERRMFFDLARRYPVDVGVLLALLLNHVTLLPNQAMYLEPGILHSYLRGTAIEIMANSDNVLRGGLTNKHVDVSGLLDVVSMEPTKPVIQGVDDNKPVARYESPAGEFSLCRIDLDGDHLLDHGPAIVICLTGQAEIGSRVLTQGSAIWIPAADGRLVARGRATMFQATVGESD